MSACHLYNADEENMFTFLTMNLKLTRSLSKFHVCSKDGQEILNLVTPEVLIKSAACCRLQESFPSTMCQQVMFLLFFFWWFRQSCRK